MPRLDRLATLYVAHPLKYVFGARQRQRVPILMYHSISDNLFGKSHPYYQINTSPKAFGRQMKWLHDAGYLTLSLSELLEVFEKGLIPAKSVVITFDDGYRDFYTDAFTYLQRYGFTATIFLATNRIQDTPVRIDGADYLTWSEVLELDAKGIEFGSHTVSHADLRSLGPEEINYELGFSKETIEDRLCKPVKLFAYPFAFPEEDQDFTRFLSGILQNQGFDLGVSTVIGCASKTDNRFFLPRLPVNSWDDVRLFQAKLEGCYDWLHGPQRWHKIIHHNVSLMQRATWIESEEMK